ncbi:hypothetical protein HID58_017026 [Brassica napus]|uniref:RRM domain-containing protein n=1 Tax=Brassica napus TaxID=3708 RepID=A0ABQ8D5X3_BRANA|nr:hypothetical protein HID58_017026 [Brassica napus]
MFYFVLIIHISLKLGGDAKKMELEPKESLSAADMPSLESKSSETFNGGSASDLSMFSSSLPTLLHEKLNMTDSDSWLSLDDKLGIGNSENDSLEDVEPDSLETLLPEDENELLPGLIDELNFNGLPDELEDCDVFCTGGGMELDVESQDNHAANAFASRKRPNTSGRVSVEHPNGEHPSRTLFVRNINSSVEDSELTALFEPFGEIRSLYTACKSRGFVMISYYDIRASHAAMRALQNTLLRKRTLDIHFSIPKENPSEKDMNQGTLVIFNVDTTVSNDELLKLFGAHGEIREIRETPNRSFHRFIEYYDVRDAESALKALDRSEIGGNWQVGSPVKGSPSHAFPRPHGLVNKSYPNAHGQANVGVNFTGSGMSLLPTVPFGGSRGLQSVRHEPFAEERRITHFETQLTDDGRYHIDLDRIATGDDTRTTLIIKNIPNKISVTWTFNGKVWENFNSGKVASLAYAEIQGKSALASYMQNPSPMKDEKHLFPEERLLSSIWNLTAPDPDWSYTADKNVNSKNIVEDEST